MNSFCKVGVRARETDRNCLRFLFFFLFSRSDVFYYTDLDLLGSTSFVSISVIDAGDDGAFTAFLSIDTDRTTDGNGKDGILVGSNLVPSGRRVDRGVSSCGEMRLGPAAIVLLLVMVKQAFCMTGDL